MIVVVRWKDGHREEFNVIESRAGDSYLWLKLVSGKERWIPIISIRWFSGVK